MDQTPECISVCNNSLPCGFQPTKKRSDLLDLQCTCNPGYFGLTCKYKISCGRCKPNKCINNTMCGECPIGWKGNQCTEYDCEKLRMCGEHGTCDISQMNKRVCVCELGWELPYCTKSNCFAKGHECGRPQQGECKLINGTYSCECKSGWNGPKCKNASCDNYNGCGQNGYCEINDHGELKCTCFNGWDGNKCQNIKCPTNHSICKDGNKYINNSVKCIENINRKCICQDKWSGYDCTKRVCNMVEIENCRKYDKGAKCIIENDNVFCKCSEEFTGNRCQYKGCREMNNCGLHGRCINSNDSSYCVCDVGWTGSECSEQLDCDQFNDCEAGQFCDIDNRGIRVCEEIFYDESMVEKINTNVSINSIIGYGATCILVVLAIIIYIFAGF